VTKKRLKPATMRDLVRFFAREGFTVEIVARPFAIVAKPKKASVLKKRPRS